MRQLSYLFPQKGVCLNEVPESEVTRPTDVKIRIAYCGICGSDVHILAGAYDGSYGKFIPPDTPIPLGREASGVVTDLGKGCRIKG